MDHDDGQMPDDYNDADVVIVGISRTSKTPTSIYLANRGIKTANIPIVHGVPLPESLLTATKPLIVGLIATTDRISQVRENRVLGTRHFVQWRRIYRPRHDRGGTEICPLALRPAQLAVDRRDQAVDRGDGGRDCCSAPQAALSAGIECFERLIRDRIPYSSLVQSLPANAHGECRPDLFCDRGRYRRARHRGAARAGGGGAGRGRPGSCQGKGQRGQRTLSRFPRDRLRPDNVVGV